MIPKSRSFLGRKWPTRCLFFIIVTLCSRITTAAEPPEGPRWEATYKIKPHEKQRLTAADVVGPDGIVYPDWRYAGVPGGIPTVSDRARIGQFGGKPDDGQDDSRALAEGAARVAGQGGGALVLEAGTYHLDQPVVLFDDNVVIRGQGMDKTKIVFRYGSPEGGVGFFGLADGQVVGPDTPIEVHALPDELQRIAVEVDGKTIYERERSLHWGGTFSIRFSASSLVGRAGNGPLVLTAVAEWTGGRRAESTITVRADRGHRLSNPRMRLAGRGLAAIMFTGGPSSGPTWKLAKDGRRGDLEITLDGPCDLKPGDAVVLDAPPTERWNELVQNACQWGTYRRNQFRVEAVDGNRVHLNQPLRLDFPTVDGSNLRKFDPIRRCGVEGLSLEQTKQLWTCGILFENAWQCWARDVEVIKAGQHAVYTRNAKWCEIRDCRFDDAWYHGGGGTAYVGWEHSYDCLMENVETWRMRHAPCVQWSSAGNVIRKSTFHGSDAQWHAGWTNENLFELCVVDAQGKSGTYGHGGWASPPEDKAHGPEGPRNVVYNCDIRAPKSGIWMGGMNENWLILYNRIVAQKGPGIFAKTFSFDHLIIGNTIAVAASNQPAVQLATADCTGVEILDNRIHGAGGKLVGGRGQPLAEDGNTMSDYTDNPPRPEPKVSSIFEWQRKP